VILLSFGKARGSWQRGRWFRSPCTALCVPLHLSKEILVVLWNKLESTKENSWTWRTELYGGEGQEVKKGRERQTLLARSSLLQRVCSGPHLRAAVPKSFECQLSAHKHSARVQRASPRQLSHFNSCVIAGDRPNCCCLGQRDEKARDNGTPWKMKQRGWWQGRC